MGDLSAGQSAFQTPAKGRNRLRVAIDALHIPEAHA
eukprot:SAG22_NODE_15548_length_346_cov_0.821862_2_plen_35_part_01